MEKRNLMWTNQRKSMASITLGLGLFLPAYATQAAESSVDAVNNEEPAETILVLGSRSANYTEITENTDKLVKMPGAMGDPLGAVTALPGVVTPAGGGAPAVRGSSPADNQYYVDGLPAGYLFHEFNTSILDENVVQDFQLYSAGFGPRYSNATGAIFDIRLRDPNKQDLSAKVTLSMLRSGVFLEGAVSENSAFYASVRQGMLQYFLEEEDQINEDGIRIIEAPKDSDYQVKYVWADNGHKLSVNLSGASDAAEAELGEYSDIVGPNPDFAGDAELNKQFDSQGITWETQFDGGLHLLASIAAYQDHDDLRWGDGYYQNLGRDGGRLRLEATVPLSTDHTLTVGTEASGDDYDFATRQVEFFCTDFDVDCSQQRGDVVSSAQKLEVNYANVYLQDFWQVTGSLELEYGVQAFYTENNEETHTNPRLAATWYAGRNWAVFGSTGRYSQLPDPGLLTDDFGNTGLKMSTADHFTLGFKGDVDEQWNWSVEGYYKKLDNLPIALDSSQPDAALHYANDAEGKARGVDMWLNRNYANGWYGWASLSFGESDRTNKRTGETRDYFLDTPVVLNLVGNMDLSEKWTAGFRFTAQSGQATTDIVGVTPNPDYPGKYLAVYNSEAYGDRLPTYSRLDIRFDREIKIFGGQGHVFLDIINALDTENVSSVGLDREKVDQTGQLATKKTLDMGIFPSLGVTFSI